MAMSVGLSNWDDDVESADAGNENIDSNNAVKRLGIYPDLKAECSDESNAKSCESALKDNQRVINENEYIAGDYMTKEQTNSITNKTQALKETVDESFVDHEELVQREHGNMPKSDIDCKANVSDKSYNDRQSYESDSQVCKPKETYSNAISSSFSTGANKDLNDGEYAEDESGHTNYNPHRECPNHAIIPGKAVRIGEHDENNYNRNANYSSELNKDIERRGKPRHQKGMKHVTDHADGGKEFKFRGLDQKYKTNDDDLYDEANEKYKYFWRKDSAFSQWHESYFHYEGIQFSSAEQFMMHQKAILFGDCQIAEKILKTKDPRKIKSLGRKVKGFTDEVWNDNCLQIVRLGNVCKFSQNNRLKEKLTGTYPKILVEASPVDTIWGIGCANDDPAAWDQSTWRGKNYLGFVLTEVRDELLCDAKFITPDEKKMYIPDLLKKMQAERSEKEKRQIGAKKKQGEKTQTEIQQTEAKKSEEENSERGMPQSKGQEEGTEV